MKETGGDKPVQQYARLKKTFFKTLHLGILMNPWIARPTPACMVGPNQVGIKNTTAMKDRAEIVA
jgi:hypothetical protein